MQALKTNEELEKQYEEARLLNNESFSSLSDIEMTERIFSNFIRQVANETN